MTQDLHFLRRQFERGDVVLFAGAGFSVGSKNRRGQSPPLAPALSRILCDECGWDFEEDALTEIYGEAQKHLGTDRLRNLLESHYLYCEPASWHHVVSGLCWHRIYTTNIDDLIPNIYRKYPGQQTLRLLVNPSPLPEVDPFMAEVMCIHLHGAVADPSKRLLFTREDLADLSASPNPLYQALIDDMTSRSVLFIGTQLNEPQFYHYLTLRDKHTSRGGDIRAKAYLVAPKISRVNARSFKERGIVCIEATAEEFFSQLTELSDGKLPLRQEIVRNRYPHQFVATDLDPQSAVGLRFLRQFDHIRPEGLPGVTNPKRSLFYMGAEPTWSDIGGGIDAYRAFTKSLVADLLSCPPGTHAFVITGYAGSGKTTCLMRAACEVARGGRNVYYFKDSSVVDAGVLLDFARGSSSQAFLFIDRASLHFDQLAEYAASAPQDSSIVFVLADRSHAVFHRLYRISGLSPDHIAMPELDRDDTELILDKLEQTGFLGYLQSKPRKSQIAEFLVRAKKQLLVALREATLGAGFDAILAGEFSSLEEEDAKLAYTVASLAVFPGALGVRRRHLIACLEGGDKARTRVLQESLREIVIPTTSGSDLLTPRHRIIGHYIAVETAPHALRKEAFQRLLLAISSDINPDHIRKRNPEYITYRGLVNFDSVVELFGKDYDTLVELYEGVRPYYSNDFLFWLQYGRMELDFNHFDLAEKNLIQSLAINPTSFQTVHQHGVLMLKRSYTLNFDSNRKKDLEEGEKILLEQIKERGNQDSYPYTAYLFHRLEFIRRRVPNGKRSDALEHLRKIAKQGLRHHPHDERLGEAVQSVERDYLMLAVPDRKAGRTH